MPIPVQAVLILLLLTLTGVAYLALSSFIQEYVSVEVSWLRFRKDIAARVEGRSGLPMLPRLVDRESSTDRAA